MTDDLPPLPMIIGQGAFADAMRAKLAAEPDRYRPETWSLTRTGVCPCCGKDVFSARTRETGWKDGYLSHDKTPHGDFENGPGCCCVPPNLSPLHDEPACAFCGRAESLCPAKDAKP